jgi:hypothetical protein
LLSSWLSLQLNYLILAACQSQLDFQSQALVELQLVLQLLSVTDS